MQHAERRVAPGLGRALPRVARPADYAVAVTGAVIIGLAAATKPLPLLALAVASVGVLLLVRLPRTVVFVGLLASALVLPLEDLPVPDRLAAYTPSVLLLLALLALTAAVDRRVAAPPRALQVAAALFAADVGISFVASGEHSPTALILASGVAAPALVVLHRRLRVDAELASTAFVYGVAALGLYAIAEKFVLGANPLLGSAFNASFGGQLQIWNSYRATTLLGHPLVNGTVFAVALVLTFGRVLTGQMRSGPGAVVGVLCAGGLIATVSRGPAIAAAAGLLLVLLTTLTRRVDGASDLDRRFIAVALLLVAVPAAAVPLVARNDSAQARDSSAVRANVIGYATKAAAGRPLLGAGPGQAEPYRLRLGLPGDKRKTPRGKITLVQLENSYAQRLVDLGYPGLLLFVALLGTAVATGLSRRVTVPYGAAIATLGISVAGYNAMSAHPQLNVLLAGLLVMMLAARRGLPVAVQ